MSLSLILIALLGHQLVIDQPIAASEVTHTKLLAKKLGYEAEVRMPDSTRCDLVGNGQAIEVEWAEKWKEAPAQATLYSIWTGHRPVVFLLVKDWQEDKDNILRAKLVCEKLRIEIVYVKVAQ